MIHFAGLRMAPSGTEASSRGSAKTRRGEHEKKTGKGGELVDSGMILVHK